MGLAAAIALAEVPAAATAAPASSVSTAAGTSAVSKGYPAEEVIDLLSGDEGDIVNSTAGGGKDLGAAGAAQDHGKVSDKACDTVVMLDAVEEESSSSASAGDVKKPCATTFQAGGATSDRGGASTLDGVLCNSPPSKTC